MPMLRAYGGRPSMRRSPNRISPASTAEKPAIVRSSVVLPQPEGPSRVNSSPSPISSETRSTAVAPPKRLVTSRSPIFIVIEGGPSTVAPRTPPFALGATRTPRSVSGLLPDGLDVAAELRLQRLRAPGGHGLVVHVGDVAVAVRAHAAGDLQRHLRGRAGRALHLVPRRDGKEPALHEDLL